eukprot:scaffold315549_cov26-Prasinocladus_malaysianus.AAC.2
MPPSRRRGTYFPDAAQAVIGTNKKGAANILLRLIVRASTAGAILILSEQQLACRGGASNRGIGIGFYHVIQDERYDITMAGSIIFISAADGQ